MIRKGIRATPLCIFQEGLFNEDCRTTSLISTIKHENSTQNYNRYSYCINNPLKYTDPSGYQYRGYDPAKTQIMIDKLNSSLWWESYQWFEGLQNDAEWSMLDALSHVDGGSLGGDPASVGGNDDVPNEAKREMFKRVLKEIGYDPSSGKPPTQEQIGKAIEMCNEINPKWDSFDALILTVGAANTFIKGGGYAYGWAIINQKGGGLKCIPIRCEIETEGFEVDMGINISFLYYQGENKSNMVNDIYGLSTSWSVNTAYVGYEYLSSKYWEGHTIGFGVGAGITKRWIITKPWY